MRLTGYNIIWTWTRKATRLDPVQIRKQIWKHQRYEDNPRRVNGVKDKQSIHGQRNCFVNNWADQLLLTTTGKLKVEEIKIKIETIDRD